MQVVAINPRDARELVASYHDRSRREATAASLEQHQERVADKIISRYATLASVSGGLTGLAGMVPGIGTAIAMVDGGLTDTAMLMKLQLDMTMCLAENFGWDLGNEDARHLAFLLAAGGVLERAGVEAAASIGSKAGVHMLRRSLKAATLRAVEKLFLHVPLVFGRKAITRSIPFGVGAMIGAAANYGLTQYVGHTAKRWFVIDRDGGGIAEG